MIEVRLADRVRNLPPYLFATIDKMKQESLSKGVDLIDLSIGDPDIPTPSHIIDSLKKASEDKENHRYPSYEGMYAFREAVANWYKRRFGVSLDPKNEVLSLIGSKEGIGHIPLAFVNPGDVVLVPSPGYPVYPVSTIFAGGEVFIMPIVESNDYLPDLEAIPEDIRNRAKMMFVNYPNNPTSALAPDEFFVRLIDFANNHNIIICHDCAYSEIFFDGVRPKSFLQYDGAKEVGIEFHSLSKTYNMTGWRIGFAVGNKDVIFGLGKIKTNIDSGVFQAIQIAGITALNTPDVVLAPIRDVYQQRRDALCDGLDEIGLKHIRPKATFYVWVKVPDGFDSTTFTAHILERCGVLCTPGVGFGAPGEGYVRFALTQSIERIKEAIKRIKGVF
ncbi:MAG: LL-diaminopimelate aminotransferase [Thermodesulfovibrionales bacterium]|nr:LL-diaminopimelate aminotransferase [Thermodesulfovibrionales bacterium]